MNFGQFIKDQRITKGITQITLSKEVGVGQGTICKWERSEASVPVEQFLKIMKVLKVKVRIEGVKL